MYYYKDICFKLAVNKLKENACRGCYVINKLFQVDMQIMNWLKVFKLVIETMAQ